MMRFVITAAMASLCASALAADGGGPAPAPPAPARSSAFWRDPALEKAVSYSEGMIPLGELVHRVAADTGADLTAASAVADEPVAVAVRNMKARDLLERVAGLLDYRWTRVPGEGEQRYEIWQDLASRQREEALREAALDQVAARLRAEADRYAALAALPAPQIQQMLAGGGQAGGPQPGTASAAQRSLIMAAARMAAPVPRSMARLLGDLSDQEWLSLAEGQPLSFSTKPGPGELLLPQAIARGLHEAAPNAQAIAPPPDSRADEDQARMQRQEWDQWQMASDFRVTVRVEGATMQYRTGGALRVTANAVPLENAAASGSPFFWPTPANSLSIAVGPAPPAPEAVPDSPQRVLALRKDPVLGASKRFVPDRPAREGVPAPSGSAAPAPWRLPELLPAIARTYGVQIISDAYWSAPVILPARIPSGPVPLYELLDRLAGSRCGWDYDGKVIRLRSRTWFLDRPREVPARLIRRWEDACRQYGSLTLDEYSTAVAGLSDEQLESLEYMVEEGLLPSSLQDLAAASAARHALRLLGSLSPQQRQSLLNGQPLPAAELGPPQRQLFLAPLRDLDRYRIAPVTAPDPRQCNLRITQQPFVRVWKEPGGGAAQLAPTAGPTAGESAHARSERPSGSVSGGQPRAESRLHRCRLVRLRIRFTYGPGSPQDTWITAAPLAAAGADTVRTDSAGNGP